jgi:hypothetical protein
MGTSQNYSDEQYIFNNCAELFVKENIKLYITFNEINYKIQTDMEKVAFNKFCIDIGCHFVSLPVKDYTPPQLKYF